MNIIMAGFATLFTILGFLTGILWERWKYFSKTGKHLQDVMKNDPF